MGADRRRAWAGRATALLLFLLALRLFPHRYCAREAPGLYAGDIALQERLARGVERHLTADLDRAAFSTGSDQFDGEWLLATYQMAGLGLGQTALEHPELRARHLALMGLCVEQILSPRVRRFDQESWREDPIDSLAGDTDHGAFLGYFNLLLSFHRLLDRGSRYADLNDRITAALVRRVERSPTLLLETYPGEVYPIDNTAVIAGIGLHDRATGSDHRALVGRWIERLREKYTDRRTGLLYQAVDAKTGAPRDAARGSGTALAQYFLSFIDPALSRALDDAVRVELDGGVLGFGAVHEYPAGTSHGRRDIDSGPIVFGFGVTATGFSISGARMHRDPERFARLVSTATLFGAPVDQGGARNHVTGGPIGDAILFAMLTAQPSLPSASP